MYLTVWFYIECYDAERQGDRRGLRYSLCFPSSKQLKIQVYILGVAHNDKRCEKHAVPLLGGNAKAVHKRLNSTTYVLHLQIISQSVLYIL
jgi:hypothetical protein